MTRLPFKAIAMACVLSLGALSMSYSPAEAGGRHHGHHRGHHGGAVAAAVAGLAIGAIIAGSAARRDYYEPEPYYAPPPPPPPYYAPPVAYSSYGPPPWTAAWYRYCSERYNSFDPRSGTFQPYYGPRRLCR